MDRQLRKAGYQVHVANHGGEALDHIRRSTYCQRDGVPLDVVLMDIEMPVSPAFLSLSLSWSDVWSGRMLTGIQVMGGLECTRRIRNMPAVRSRLAIVAITANARSEQQTEALNAGVDAVVTKPFQMGELLGVVDSEWSTKE